MKKLETFETFKSESDLLKKYIDYYYIHRANTPEFIKEYTFYPHVKHAISIYKNCSVQVEGQSSFAFYDEMVDYTSIYSPVLKHPVKVRQKGMINKIAIVFKPLGINRFIPMALDKIITKFVSDFNPYGAEYITLLDQVFDTDNLSIKQQLLDDFFEKKYVDFEEPVLIKAVAQLVGGATNVKIEDLAETLNVSRKTLYRLFKKHMCCSPEEFKNVARFRHSLTNKLLYNKSEKLTNIAYESNYYDQADFIKNYKKITGASPKKFLKGGKLIGDEDTFWTFWNEKGDE